MVKAKAPAKPKADEFISLGWQVIDFVEQLLVHGPGDVEGDPIVVDDEFAAAILRMYRLDGNGRRVVKRYTLSRAKGRAKSELAAMICIVEALGPCRFDHWAEAGERSWWGYEYAPGEPVGRPVRSPFIRCLATEEGQTGNTYGNVTAMLQSGRIAELVPKIDAGDTRTYVYGPQGDMPRGEIRPNSAAAASKDGGKETFAVADEVHLYASPPLKRMYETVDRNCRKRKIAEPWMLNTTTAYLVGEGSVAEELFDQGTSPSGVIDHKAGCVSIDGLKLHDLRNARQPEWKQLRAALAVAYESAASWMDLDGIIREEFAPKRKDKGLSARYFLNVPQVQQSWGGWLHDHPQAWASCLSPLELVPAARTWVAVDGSLNRDSTSVAWVQHVDGRVVVRQRCWTPADSGGRIPYDEVRQHIRDLAAMFEVVEIQYDPRYFAESALLLQDEGYPLMELPQSQERMTPICGAAAEVLLDGRLAHDGDPILTRHVHGAQKKPNERGFTFSKVKSGQHIDAWIAAVMALDAALAPAKVERRIMVAFT